jgi:hypothetical protein
VPKEAILQEEASRKRAADFWELNMKYSLVPGSNAPEGSSDPFMSHPVIENCSVLVTRTRETEGDKNLWYLDGGRSASRAHWCLFLSLVVG